MVSMNLKSFVIYVRDRGDFFVLTTVFGPEGTIAHVNPERFETVEALELNLPALIQERLAASHYKSDISGDEAEEVPFLKSIKAKTWNAFYRDCTSVGIVRSPRCQSITVGHWDRRGFDSNPEDRTELPASATLEEVANQLSRIIRQVVADN